MSSVLVLVPVPVLAVWGPQCRKVFVGKDSKAVQNHL